MPNALPPVPPAWDKVITRLEIDEASKKLSPKTISARVYHLRRFALAMPVPPARLNRDHVAGYLALPNWKAINTYNVVRGHIRAFLVFAQDRGIITADLLSVLPPPKRQGTRVARAAPPSVVENALASPSPRDRKMILLSAIGGLKPGEISQVHSDDLEQNADAEYRLIARQISGSKRIVLLRPDLAEMILASEPGFLFPGKINGHISSAYVSRLISRRLPKGMSALQLRNAFEEALIRHSWTAQSAVTATSERAILNESLFHPWVWEGARSLWASGHLREAVRTAATNLNLELQKKVGRTTLSDTKLIQELFSVKPPEAGKPRLRLPGDDGGETAKSLREGVMQFGAGCFLALRNPTTHGLDEIPRQEALEKLGALSQLARWLDSATVTTD